MSQDHCFWQFSKYSTASRHRRDYAVIGIIFRTPQNGIRSSTDSFLRSQKTGRRSAESIEIILRCLRSTVIKTGRTVIANLIESDYEKGITELRKWRQHTEMELHDQTNAKGHRRHARHTMKMTSYFCTNPKWVK